MSSTIIAVDGRSQWPRGLSRGLAAPRLLGLRIRMLQKACCECCVLFGRSLASGWSLVQRNPTECLSVIVKPR